jgi:hypothetical protein
VKQEELQTMGRDRGLTGAGDGVDRREAEIARIGPPLENACQLLEIQQ